MKRLNKYKIGGNGVLFVKPIKAKNLDDAIVKAKELIYKYNIKMQKKHDRKYSWTYYPMELENINIIEKSI